MAVEPEGQMVAEAVGVESATVEEGDDGNGNCEQATGDEENRRASEAEPRATEGVVGDDTGPSQTPPRDPAKGKGVVGSEEHVEEEQTTEADLIEIREEHIAFRPPATAATSSRHVPITLDDIAAHAPDEILAKVLEDHPEIGEYVLKAKEDRARAIEESEASARAEREAERERAGPEGLAADVEAEEAQGPRVSAVTEAGALTCP
ncbi:hypothetical protein RHMOL_Rhmol04G0210400 [Rhododendron molle]|uniref:Uncharacterized protein n=1 Tax=Rhododendron molle TaxID=49168 RepID=A0ACC0P4C6_RHOML|nr:hypothetical protein RHMOL_Rhmol04G0210400 [Rhododendron molle]